MGCKYDYQNNYLSVDENQKCLIRIEKKDDDSHLIPLNFGKG